MSPTVICPLAGLRLTVCALKLRLAQLVTREGGPVHSTGVRVTPEAHSAIVQASVLLARQQTELLHAPVVKGLPLLGLLVQSRGDQEAARGQALVWFVVSPALAFSAQRLSCTALRLSALLLSSISHLSAAACRAMAALRWKRERERESRTQQLAVSWSLVSPGCA